ncbi:hypothetical protein H5410_004180 [Solanum commersonii]|uniref:Uncharacterized protein n=1 Tax=Solanum commersonii TaxID=4109 RepID=A0A9J6B7R1_SOLCO|nr:hypothetical protein H5410_004180 [Solanum commersonii]
MANPLIAYSDDKSFSDLTEPRSIPASLDAPMQGEGDHSTKTSLTLLPQDSTPINPFPIGTQSPLPTYRH